MKELPHTPRRGPSRWHFDIDHFLNPLVPPSLLPRLPSPVAHFLGYRTHAPQHALGNLAMVFWAVIGVFSSLAIIGTVNEAMPAFQHRTVPIITGSYGAAAVLAFYAIESPLAQPRNAILGQAVSALIGICICKLLALSPDFGSLRWLGASLACACATAVMALTGTVHPPAGATALMTVLDPSVSALGWFALVPLLLDCALMLGVALLVNNIQRRFPFYWWSPHETGQFWRRRRGAIETEGEKSVGADLEQQKHDGSSSSTSSDDGVESGGVLAIRSVSVEDGREGEIIIRRGAVRIPPGFSLRPEEILLLETLSERL